MESYASNWDVTGHSKDELRAIKTLEQTTRITGEIFEVASVARRQCEVTKCAQHGTTQVPITTPTER